jgi:hypothetical protein
MNHRHQIFYGPAGLPGNFGNLIGHFFLAGKAKGWWNVRIVDNRFSICFTPWEAAAPSLGARQGVEHFFHLGIRFNMKLLRRHGQADAEKQPDARQCGDSP